MSLFAVLFSIFVFCKRWSRVNCASWAVWVIHVILISGSFGFFSLWDYSLHFYLFQTVFTAISLGIAVFSLVSNHYLESATSFFVIISSSILPLEMFLLFTNMSYVTIAFVYGMTVVFGFFVNHDVRKSIRHTASGKRKQNYVTGSINVYFEIILVFFRVFELIVSTLRKNKNNLIEQRIKKNLIQKLIPENSYSEFKKTQNRKVNNKITN